MKEAICHIFCRMLAASLDVLSQGGDRLPVFHAIPALLMLQTVPFYIVKKQNNPLLLLELMPKPEQCISVSCLCAGVCSSSAVTAAVGLLGELLKSRSLWLGYCPRYSVFSSKL